MADHPKTNFHDQAHAREYDQRAAQSDLRSRLAPKLLQALDLEGNETVLDLATGTGRFARPVSERLNKGKIIGLDEAMAMLRVSQEEKAKHPIDRYYAVQGAAEAFPLGTATCDRVITVFALHHFGEVTSVFSEAARVLRSGGRFIILDPVAVNAKDTLDQILHYSINQILREAYGENFHIYSTNDVHALLSRAGLQPEHSEVMTFDIDQDGMEGIPTGRHWLPVAQQLNEKSAEIGGRFEERYFRLESRGKEFHIKGKFHFGLVMGVKP